MLNQFFKRVYILLLCLNCAAVFSQSNSNIAVTGKLGIGLHAISVDNFGTQNVFAKPASALTLDAGFKYRYKNSFSASFKAGLNLFSYDFVVPDISYSVYYFGWKSEATLEKYFETPSLPIDFLNLGFTGGWQFLSDESLTTDIDDFKGVSSTKKSSPFYISPHIGTFRREDRFSYSLSVFYSYLFQTNGFIEFDMQAPTVDSQARHRGNYLGINIVVDYDLHRKHKEKPTPPPIAIDLPDNYASRKVDTQGRLETKDSKVILKVWDHGQEDNDIISVLLNGEVVLNKYTIRHKKKRIKLRLQEGENTLTIIAHNEGTLRPNTATIYAKSGNKAKYFSISSSLDTNAEIDLNYLIDTD